MENSERKYSVAKYIFGEIYLLISIVFILNMMNLISTFKIWGYCIIAIIIILVLTTIVTRLLKKGKVANVLIGIGIAITLICNLYVMIANIGRVEYDDKISNTTFNQKFTLYEGIKSGAEVRALLQQVRTSNSTEENKDRIVAVEFENYGEIITRENPTQFKSNWNNGKILVRKKYSIEVQYAENHVINKVIINEVKTNE